MEHTLKKKTRNLITLRTNNFIQAEIEKQIFFSQVLQTLQAQFDAKQYQFLTAYLLINQNNQYKKYKSDNNRNNTQKRIYTQPEQRHNNLSQIDPNIFHQEFNKTNTCFLNSRQFYTKQIDNNCTNTPKKKLKTILFQNKKVLDLDRKLQKRYSQQKNKFLYKPKSLLSQRKQFNLKDNWQVKTSYKQSYLKENRKSELPISIKSQNMKKSKIYSYDHIESLKYDRILNLTMSQFNQNLLEYKLKNKLKKQSHKLNQRNSLNQYLISKDNHNNHKSNSHKDNNRKNNSHKQNQYERPSQFFSDLKINKKFQCFL